MSGHREQLVQALLKRLVDASSLPDWLTVHVLGRDLGPLAELLADAVLEGYRGESPTEQELDGLEHVAALLWNWGARHPQDPPLPEAWEQASDWLAQVVGIRVADLEHHAVECERIGVEALEQRILAEQRLAAVEAERDHLASTLAGLRRVHGETVQRRGGPFTSAFGSAIPNCPTCGAAVDSLYSPNLAEGYCLAMPCAHAVRATVWPDEHRVELAETGRG